MTVKELSEFTGKTERAVRNWVHKATEKSTVVKEKSSASSPMKPASYTVDEVELILNESRLGQNAVMIIMENARRVNHATSAIPGQVDYEAIGKMIAIAVSTALEPIITKLTTQEPVKRLQIESAPQKDPRKELSSLVYKYAVEQFDGVVREAWWVVYEEIYLRVGKRIMVLANNRGVSKMDIIESYGLLDMTMAIVKELME